MDIAEGGAPGAARIFLPTRRRLLLAYTSVFLRSGVTLDDSASSHEAYVHRAYHYWRAARHLQNEHPRRESSRVAINVN